MENLIRINREIPLMHYADGLVLGPWDESRLRLLTQTEISERLSRRPIDEGEAIEIFRIMKRIFNIHDAKMKLLDSPCPTAPCKSRDFADASFDTHVIRISRRIFLLGEGQFIGLMGHELGHLADPTPGRTGMEKRADAIAREKLGIDIKYDRCDVQTIGPGSLIRPAYLHQ